MRVCMLCAFFGGESEIKEKRTEELFVKEMLCE